MPAEMEPQLECDDGPLCWVCQFVDCDEHPEEPLLSTGCACCREGSSGGRAHVSCLVGAAAHQPKLWVTCPTCKQKFTGAVRTGLCQARWELYRNRPETDSERLAAMSFLAASLDADPRRQRLLNEELVAISVRNFGEDHPGTLVAVAHLGCVLSRRGSSTTQRRFYDTLL